jgi:dATP pyrophosphohydrolase
MSPPAWKRPESVLVVVHTPAGEILLLERVAPRGWWQSVTGALAADESPVDAARREVQEETGFAPEDLRDLGLSRRYPIHPAWRSRYAPDVAENLEHAFALELPQPSTPRLAASEHRGWAWLSLADAQHRATSETDRAAIAAACRPGRSGSDRNK